MSKGSENRVGPLFKMDGGFVIMVFDILHQVKVRKKIDLVKFQKYLYRKIELEKLDKDDIKTRHKKMYSY